MSCGAMEWAFVAFTAIALPGLLLLVIFVTIAAYRDLMGRREP